MPKFSYVAEAADGSHVKGLQEAETMTSARVALLSRDLSVKKLEEKRSILQLELTKTRIKRTELMHLSRQLAAFIRAGVPILDAIRVLGEESDSRGVQRVMGEIGEDLRAGATLSDAFDMHPNDFPAFYRGILRSAELTGRLDSVLDQLAVYIDRDLETRRKIKGALIYPGVVLVMAAGTVVVLSTYVLPKFKDFFESLDAKLPLATRMLLAFTRFLATAWMPLVLGFVAMALLGFLASRTERGRYLRDSTLLRLPALGETVRYVIVERYCRILASMVTAGVSLTDSLVVARDSLHNRVFERRLNEAYETVLEGGGLAAPLVKTQLFPATVTQMVRVGEETGSLDAQLTVAAEFFERELDYKIKRLTALFEPAVIVVAGGIVGFVAIALVSAMYGIFRQAHIS